MGLTSATAPTLTTSVTTGFTGLGYVGEDGITETRDRSVDDIKAWQNADTVRSVVTDASLSYSFTLIETSIATVQLFYGATAVTTVPEGNILIVPSATGGRRSFIIDVIDGAELRRTYIPSGELTEVGDLVYANGEPIGYECTITAYPAAAISASAKVFATALKT